MKTIPEIIEDALKEGGLLDALLALQHEQGYIREEALTVLAGRIGVSPAELYDTVSFYSMLRFTPPAPVEIRLCHGTACHSAGNAALAEALEEWTGLRMGQRNERYSIGWVECLGHCGEAPSVLVNNKLYTKVDISALKKILGGDPA